MRAHHLPAPRAAAASVRRQHERGPSPALSSLGPDSRPGRPTVPTGAQQSSTLVVVGVHWCFVLATGSEWSHASTVLNPAIALYIMVDGQVVVRPSWYEILKTGVTLLPAESP